MYWSLRFLLAAIICKLGCCLRLEDLTWFIFSPITVGLPVD